MKVYLHGNRPEKIHFHFYGFVLALGVHGLIAIKAMRGRHALLLAVLFFARHESRKHSPLPRALARAASAAR
ncbi:MAG: hypothetical protein CPSOU_1252 [uncultured Paraburkholderia sp.]|nr:MAG: hypothetical protein CPSOU_1252 [uncultured Paraburkholderia sp.]